MDIDQVDVELTFYKTKFTDKNGRTTAGLYRGINENDKYHVQLNEAIIENHELLVAVLAHELCHVKLIGEDVDDNADDEYLTDFATVFFGLGIFNANASKEYYHNGMEVTFADTGYMSENEFAYVLALFAYYKKDFKAEWSKYLSPTIKQFFKMNLQYLIKNEATLFTEKANPIEFVRRYKETKGLRFLD
jgi:SprT-like family